MELLASLGVPLVGLSLGLLILALVYIARLVQESNRLAASNIEIQERASEVSLQLAAEQRAHFEEVTKIVVTELRAQSADFTRALRTDAAERRRLLREHEGLSPEFDPVPVVAPPNTSADPWAGPSSPLPWSSGKSNSVPEDGPTPRSGLDIPAVLRDDPSSGENIAGTPVTRRQGRRHGR